MFGFVDWEISIYGKLTPPLVPLVKYSTLWKEHAVGGIAYFTKARKQRKSHVPIVSFWHTPVTALPIDSQLLQVKLQALPKNILDPNCSEVGVVFEDHF